MTHRVTIDHVPADRTDTEAYAAFCDDCSWRGEWHHADLSGDPAEAADLAHTEAVADMTQHQIDTNPNTLGQTTTHGG